VAVGNQAGGEAEEGFVDVVASFPADPKAAEAVPSGDALTWECSSGPASGGRAPDAGTAKNLVRGADGTG
jgi:hypothetical protein